MSIVEILIVAFLIVKFRELLTTDIDDETNLIACELLLQDLVDLKGGKESYSDNSRNKKSRRRQ